MRRSSAFRSVPCGAEFGALTVLGIAAGRYRWQCRCRCGSVRDYYYADVLRGATASCGCAQNIKHGHARKGRQSAEYRAWRAMIDRCNNPKTAYWSRYGGRGIRVCANWMSDFEAFLLHIGPRPSAGHSVDRYPDPDGDYEPGNVRWATAREQAANKTQTKSASVVEYMGRSQSLSDWARELGLSFSLLRDRLRMGWTVERMFTQARQVQCKKIRSGSPI